MCQVAYDRANVLWRGIVLACLLCVCLAQPAAAEAPMVTDALAGVSFLQPFAQPLPKTAEQVRGLLVRQGGVRIPTAAEFTSGIYTQTAPRPPYLPYLLVWTLKPTEDLDRSELVRLAASSALGALHGPSGALTIDAWEFDAALLRGVGKATLSPTLKARFLVQIATGKIVYLGYFYEDAADVALFDPVISSFRLNPAAALDPAELPRGRWFYQRLAATIAMFAFGAGVPIYLRRRSRYSA